MDSDTSRSPEPGAFTEEALPAGVSAGSSSPLQKLQREVLYPQRQNTGVGIMLVASAAMFFAVASSAFVLRAQMPMSEECPGSNSARTHYQRVQSPHEKRIEAVEVEVVDITAIEANTISCGEPLFVDNDKGPSSIVFRLCDPQP